MKDIPLYFLVSLQLRDLSAFLLFRDFTLTLIFWNWHSDIVPKHFGWIRRCLPQQWTVYSRLIFNFTNKFLAGNCF